MKISELIELLQREKVVHGDIAIFRTDSESCDEEIHGITTHKYNKNIDSKPYLILY